MSERHHPPAGRHRVLIVGGGFGGLEVARELRDAPVDVTLVDRRNFHLFQPLLYQVATGGLSPANIAAPLRTILRDQANANVVLGEVTGFDLACHEVRLADGALPYDTLVVAAGGRTSWFGHADWEAAAPGLKTIEDARHVRMEVLSAFEAAERGAHPDETRALLTFVVVGGGPTGVELAGTLGEIARYTLRREFRHIDPGSARIILVEAGERILPTYSPALSAAAAASLARLGVEVLTRTRVLSVEPGAATLAPADVPPGSPDSAASRRLPARTVLWAAGVAASPLADALAQACGAKQDRLGRVEVTPKLNVPGHPEVFALGDMVTLPGADGRPLPGVAPVALQQGRHVARTLRARLSGRPAPEPFHYRDRGSMATIGRTAAVAQIGRLELHGYPAWLTWLFVHLMALVRFENRLLVLLQWAWNYITFSRSARLIS